MKPRPASPVSSRDTRLWPRIRLWREFVIKKLNLLRWRLRSEESRIRWTQRRLQCNESGWLFILGLSNSGTTMLYRILRSHPEIRSLPREGHLLTPALPSPNYDYGLERNWTRRLDVFRMTEADDPAVAQRVMHDWAGWYPRRPGILMDKSPPNTIRARWLQANFQPCRFIMLARSPYAVCEGISRRQGCTIEEAARHWSLAHELYLEDVPKLSSLMFLSYEAFCANPDEYLKRISTFLSLGSPLVQSSSQPLKVHNITNKPQPIQNMNDRSWNKLSAEDIQVINSLTNETMRKLGYKVRQPDQCGNDA